MTSFLQSKVPIELDSPGWVKRLGIIVLSTDLTTERDAQRVIPQDLAACHVTRVAFANPTTLENLRQMTPRLSEAARLLGSVPDLQAVWYSCTAASVEIGDYAIADSLSDALPHVPVVTPPLAAVEGFAALGVRRIALLTPYLRETTEPMVRYFTNAGLDIRNAQYLGMADDRDMARVSPETILRAVEQVDVADAEGIFVSCTALPALGVIARIEARLGKPVLSSNQASLWRVLHHAGLMPKPDAPGRLFSATPLEQAA